MDESQIVDKIKQIDSEALQIKEEVFRLCWFMRGGVNSEDLLWKYTREDREIISKIAKDNMELTKDSGLPLL